MTLNEMELRQICREIIVDGFRVIQMELMSRSQSNWVDEMAVNETELSN